MWMSGSNQKLFKKDILVYDVQDILCKIEAPQQLNNRTVYSVKQLDGLKSRKNIKHS